MQGQGNLAGSKPSGTETPALDDSTQIQLTVDGEMVTKTIAELKQGFAAGSKMTQATQRAAEAEKELAQWKTFKAELDRDPAGTISTISKSYGVTPQAPAPSEENQDDDPMSTEAAELRQELATMARNFEVLQTQLSTQAQGQKMNQEVAELKEQFGAAFVPDEVMTYATAHNIRDLRTAFYAQRGEKSAADSPIPTGVPRAPSNVAPGAPVSNSSVETLPQASSVTEALMRAYEQAGQEVTVADLIPG